MSDSNSGTEQKKSRRGFAAMSAEKQREIASKGGKTAHARGTAHQFTPEEARAAAAKATRRRAENKASRAN